MTVEQLECEMRKINFLYPEMEKLPHTKKRILVKLN